MALFGQFSWRCAAATAKAHRLQTIQPPATTRQSRQSAHYQSTIRADESWPKAAEARAICEHLFVSSVTSCLNQSISEFFGRCRAGRERKAVRLARGDVPSSLRLLA